MAHRFNVFSGLDRHINKKNKSIPVNHEPDNNRITPEQIKDIVSREDNAASTRSQMMNYFDSIAASSERTETMLVELRDALDAGLAKIDEAAGRNDDGERLEQIDASVKQVIEMSGSLKDNLDAIEESVKNTKEIDIDESVKRIENGYENLGADMHKDNLITYKNLRQALEEAENKAIKRDAGLKKGITACLVMNVILLVAVIVLVLRGFGII